MLLRLVLCPIRAVLLAALLVLAADPATAPAMHAKWQLHSTEPIVSMDVQSAIQAAEAKAKRQAIVDRLLDWIERSDTVDIVKENPTMEPESSYVTAQMLPTGELTIELRLTGIKDIAARLKEGGRRQESDDWFAI